MNNTIYNMSFQALNVSIFQPISNNNCQLSEKLLIDSLEKVPIRIFILLLIIFILLNIRFLILPKFELAINYISNIDTFILGAFSIALLLLYLYTFKTEHIYRNLLIGFGILFSILFLSKYILDKKLKVKI